MKWPDRLYYSCTCNLLYIPYLNNTGLAGDNDLQNAEIGSIVDFIVDIGKSCESVMKETDEAKKVWYIAIATHTDN